jgi:hypothetical protein
MRKSRRKRRLQRARTQSREKNKINTEQQEKKEKRSLLWCRLLIYAMCKFIFTSRLFQYVVIFNCHFCSMAFMLAVLSEETTERETRESTITEFV